MEQARIKLIIVIVSCLFHLFVLLFLLIFYHTPTDSLVSANVDTPQTIFYDPPSMPPAFLQPPVQQDESWAELKPRAGVLGDSMEMPNGEVGIPHEEAETNQESEDSSIHAENCALGTNGENNTPFVVSDCATIVSNHTNKVSEKKSKQNIKQQAQKVLAGITKGYLEQLSHEGDNLIKTFGGDPNKIPTDKQLKYERYLAKIIWCIQNAHTINREKCQLSQPIQTTIMLSFNLNRAGKMSNLRIVQSSGHSFIDKYFISLFEFASNSFPPLPAYIQEDPLQLSLGTTIGPITNPSPYISFTRN